MFLRRYRPAAFAAVLAIALQALWPLLAHAKPAQAPHLVPLCTVDGTTHFVELPPGKAPAEEHAGTQHCKLCVFGGERLAALAPAPFPPLHVEGTVAVAVPAGIAVAVISCSASPAQPRAPPALS